MAIPLFLIAWPVAILTDHVPLTFAVFVGVYVATKLEPQFGAADGKLMVGMAAFAPPALGIGILLELGIFAAMPRFCRWNSSIPGALCLHVGSALSALVLIIIHEG